jgi:hypothetical protein
MKSSINNLILRFKGVFIIIGGYVPITFQVMNFTKKTGRATLLGESTARLVSAQHGY